MVYYIHCTNLSSNWWPACKAGKKVHGWKSRFFREDIESLSFKISEISRCSSPVQEQAAMSMRPNTTPLSVIYSDLSREVFSPISKNLTCAKDALGVQNPKQALCGPKMITFLNRRSANTSHHTKCDLRKTCIVFHRKTFHTTRSISPQNTSLHNKYFYIKTLDFTDMVLHKKTSLLAKHDCKTIIMKSTW